MELNRKRILGAVLGVVLGAGFVLLCPDVGLSEQGIACLGILLGAVVWWITGVLPEFATGLAMVVLFAVFAGVGLDVSMSSFTSGTWWLLVAAFSLGAGMKTSGLMRRMAYAILRVFPASFEAQVAGFVAAGTVLGPLVPSLAAKTAMLTPIAMEVGDALGFERKGKQMQGLFLAMLVGVRNIGPAVVSASVVGYALLALLPADVQARFDMLHWFVAALPWFVVVTVLNLVALIALYRPNKASSGSVRVSEKTSARSEMSAKSRQLGPMSSKEKRMLAIVLLTVAAWVAEPLHHVAAHVVGLVALVALMAGGVLDKRSFRTEVSWESLVFIGTVFGLSAVFAHVGIDTWIVGVAGPVFEAMAQNPYVFVVGIGVVTVLLRFVIVSEVAYLNIVMVFLVPLAIGFGVNPWVVGIAIFATVNPWFTLYQNPVYLAAFYSVDGKMVRHADMAKYCVLYMVICLVGLAASVPYWQWMGLL